MGEKQLELFEFLVSQGLLSKSRPTKVGADDRQEYMDYTPKNASVNPLAAYRLNPHSRYFRSRNIIDPGRRIDYKILRRVAEKAWLINTIISHQINKIRPFLRISPNDQERGFRVALVDGQRKPTGEERRKIMALERWIGRTGFQDAEREDSLVEFGSKLLRDLYTLDQVSTEIQRTVGGKPFAFWAVDPATILRVNEGGYDGDSRIKYIQEIDLVPVAQFTARDMIFSYQNPRSDIDHSFYGYSKVEQAIELIITFIHSFAYNAGAFTEDRLPRGMLLLQGDADVEEVEVMEDYIINLMSGGPIAKWKIPIVPSGGSGGDRKIEWVNFQNSNKDMEYSQWTEATWTSVAALFDTDLEELGIRTQKSSSVLGDNVAGKIELSKSRGLSSNLSFLKSHLDKVLAMIDPRMCLKFTGLEPDDIRAKNEAREAELRTIKTIDELRAESDLRPFGEDWSKIPLNPYVIQLVQASKQGQGPSAGQERPEDQLSPSPQGKGPSRGFKPGGYEDQETQEQDEAPPDTEADPGWERKPARNQGDKRTVFDVFAKAMRETDLSKIRR